jgi:hypothetical protein
MNSKPLVGANLSQAVFKQNEKLIEPVKNNMFSSKYDSMLTLSDVNSNSDTMSDMSSIMPAYISQSRMSTHFQDDPWDILTFGKKYGSDNILGGSINPNIKPGSRPGNTYKGQ